MKADLILCVDDGAVLSMEKGGFFRQLQAAGLYHRMEAHMYAVLRLFARIYQAFRILGMMVRNRKNPREILKQ